MNKKIFILLIIVLGIFSTLSLAEISQNEEKTRKLLSESLNLLFQNKKSEARQKLDEALTGQIYLEDIPKFWYYAAKLDLQLGLIDKAKQDIENVLLFSLQNEEINTVRDFISSMENFSFQNYSKPLYSKLFTIEGNKKSFERFFTVNDMEVLNSVAYILDSKNNRIFKYDGVNEKWIMLPGDNKYYSIYADQKLNKIYLGTKRGLFYFESYSPFVKYESVINKINIKNFSENDRLKGVEGVLKPVNTESPFFIYGVDKIGRIIGYNPVANEIKIVGYDGTTLFKKQFKDDTIFVAGAVWNNYIYMIDAVSRQLFIYDMTLDEIINKYKLSAKTYYSLSVLPWGFPVVSSVESGVEYYDITKNKLFPFFDQKSEYKSFKGNIKIKNGLMLVMDYINYTVSMNRILAESKLSPYNISIYATTFDKKKYLTSAKLNILDINGTGLEYITKDFLVQDSGGRVVYNHYKNYSISDVYEFDNLQNYFGYGQSQTKIGSYIIIKNESDYIPTLTQNIPLILSGSSLFYITNSKIIEPKLKEIIYSSGGSVVKTSEYNYLKQYLSNCYRITDFIEYKLNPPIMKGLKQTKILFNIKTKTISDTLYYYSEGVGVE